MVLVTCNLHLFYQQSVHFAHILLIGLGGFHANIFTKIGQYWFLNVCRQGRKEPSRHWWKFTLFTKFATSWMEESRKLPSSQPLSQDSVNTSSPLSTHSVCRHSHHQDEIWIQIATGFMWWKEVYFRSRTHKGFTCLKTKTKTNSSIFYT